MLITLGITGPSKWTYLPSSSFGIGYGLVAGEGGIMTLRDPTGSSVDFYYLVLRTSVLSSYGKRLNPNCTQTLRCHLLAAEIEARRRQLNLRLLLGGGNVQGLKTARASP